MREIENCPICKNTGRQIVYPGTVDFLNVPQALLAPYGSHYQINRCAGCGLLFSGPIFEDHEIEALYEQATEGNVSSGEEQNVKETMRLYYELAKPYLQQRDRILDIGCDIGLMLEFASEDGFKELHGLEPNTVAREKAAMIPRAIISKQFYEAQDFPNDYFDLITFVHVVDHLIDPTKVVERAYRHAKPGGLVVAVVHNSESVLAKLLGEKFPPFNLYHHFFFTKKTLAHLFESRGFEAVRVSSTKNCYSLRFFFQRVPFVPLFLRKFTVSLLDRIGIGDVPITIPIGNIGIVARRPKSALPS